MKLLITGRPGTGKTTLLKSLIEFMPGAFWVITEEIRNNEGYRVGFIGKTSTGLKETIAHKFNIQSDMAVGSYKVDINSVDRVLSQPIADTVKTGQPLIIDEIGKMEMLSVHFREVIWQAFNSDSDLIASIAYNAKWTANFTNRSNVITLVITPDSRSKAKDIIKFIIKAQPSMKRLNYQQQKIVVKLANKYGEESSFIQLRKLFKNAVMYLEKKRVSLVSDNQYLIQGNTNNHKIFFSNDSWSCDCDLFNGLGRFSGKAGECSHIQSARIFDLR